LSRATVITFKHNDIFHLRTILEGIAADDKRLRRDTQQQRRFIVVEGLYRNTGDLCPLPALIDLKYEFFYRLIVDESLSFGAVGRTGRGVTEHFHVDIQDVDICNMAMDTSLASVGGLCVGARDVVDHQRLSGAGYCFSASSPPFLSAVGVAALDKLQQEPEHVLRLQQNAQLLGEGLAKIAGLSLGAISPVMHLSLRTADLPHIFPPVSPPTTSTAPQVKGSQGGNKSRGLEEFEERWNQDMSVLQSICKYCMDNGVGVTLTKYKSHISPWTAAQAGAQTSAEMPASVRPSIKVCASAVLTEEQIRQVVRVIQAGASAVLNVV